MFEKDGFNELCLHFRLNAGLWGSKQLAQLANVLFLSDYQHASHARLNVAPNLSTSSDIVSIGKMSCKLCLVHQQPERIFALAMQMCNVW